MDVFEIQKMIENREEFNIETSLTYSVKLNDNRHWRECAHGFGLGHGGRPALLATKIVDSKYLLKVTGDDFMPISTNDTRISDTSMGCKVLTIKFADKCKGLYTFGGFCTLSIYESK